MKSTAEKIVLLALAGLIGLFLFIGLLTVVEYNGLVKSRNNTDKAWSKVETQYQRRFDLIGNLVSSVKGAQGQEQKVFGDIAKARTQYMQASNPNDKAAAASAVETNLAIVPRLQEAYPDLKSNATVQQLMGDLKGTEDSILAVRNTYNDTANSYNIKIEKFPRSIFANIFGYHPRALFQADSGASQVPKVQF